MEYKVSVIIPVYKVEKFIERCVRSLMEQTLKNIEYIFVDDATPDSSIIMLHSILSDYPERFNHVKILSHIENKGLPAARNTGLAAAHGEYVFHCDSDDFVEKNLLLTLYETACREGADIVWSDYYISYPNNERYLKQPSYDTPEAALKGMLHGRMKYNVWNKLAKRSLYIEHNIKFPEGYAMGEDMTMMFLFSYARKVAYVGKALYHYVSNNASMTNVPKPRHLVELKYNSDRVLSFLEKRYNGTWKEEGYSFMLLMKWPFLTGHDSKLYPLWKEWCPEANSYIWKRKEVALRIRFIEACAAHGQFWLVKLHDWIVLRFLYSLMYKNNSSWKL